MISRQLTEKPAPQKNLRSGFFICMILNQKSELEAHAGAPCVKLVLEFVDNNVNTGSVEGVEERGQGGLGISKTAYQGA